MNFTPIILVLGLLIVVGAVRLVKYCCQKSKCAVKPAESNSYKTNDATKAFTNHATRESKTYASILSTNYGTRPSANLSKFYQSNRRNVEKRFDKSMIHLRNWNENQSIYYYHYTSLSIASLIIKDSIVLEKISKI